MKHLDEQTLIVHLDRDPTEPGERRTVEHLATCDECRRRYDRLRVRSKRLAELFAAEEAEPLPSGEPSRPRRLAHPHAYRDRRRGLLAAGVVLLLGLVGLGPAWALLREGFEAPVVPTSPANTAAPVTDVVFPVDAPEFEIRVLRTAPQGALDVVIDDVAQGRVTVRGGDTSDEVVVRAGRLEIAPSTTGEHAVRFHVVLPAHVRRVRLTGVVSDRVVAWEPTPDAIPRHARVPLR